ncbi:MAG: RidA family protein [Terriglobales bacterium]
MKLVLGLCLVGILLTVAALAQSESSKANASSRRHVVTPRPVQPPFSDAVVVGNTAYVAGHIGLDPKTGKLPESVDEEIKLLLDGFRRTVGEAGMTMDDLVFVQVFSPDLSLYAKFNAAYKTYFGKEYPARAFIGSGPLLFGGHFEMNGIAVKR